MYLYMSRTIDQYGPLVSGFAPMIALGISAPPDQR